MERENYVYNYVIREKFPRFLFGFDLRRLPAVRTTLRSTFSHPSVGLPTLPFRRRLLTAILLSG